MPAMTKTRGQRLRLAREKFFKSARSAAEALDMPPATYGSHERAETPGGRDYGPDEAERYGRRFHVRPEWLLTGRDEVDAPPEAPDETPPRRMAPIVGYVGANSERHTYAVPAGQLGEVEAPEGSSDKTVAVEIIGSSLGNFFDRWIAFYEDVRTPPTTDLLGQLCVVGLADERVLIKKLKRAAGGRFDLISNADEDPIRGVVIKWAARVTAMEPR